MSLNERNSRFSYRRLVAIALVSLVIVGGGIAAVLQFTNRGPAVGTAEFDKQKLCQLAAELDDTETTELNMQKYESWLFDATTAFGALVAIQDDAWVPIAESLAGTPYGADGDFSKIFAAIDERCEADDIKVASDTDREFAGDTACAYMDYIDSLPDSDAKTLAKDGVDLRRLAVASSLFSADYLMRTELPDDFEVKDLPGYRIIGALRAFDDDALQNEVLPEVRTVCAEP